MSNVPPASQMYPVVAGAIVPVYNLPGVDLVLTRQLVSQIFRQCCSAQCPTASCRGWSANTNTSNACADDVSLWTDPKILALNPGLDARLKELRIDPRIRVVVREDTSGMTEIFKKSLASFEGAFGAQIGTSSEPDWASACVDRRQKNAGVSAAVIAMPGSIGSVQLPRRHTREREGENREREREHGGERGGERGGLFIRSPEPPRVRRGRGGAAHPQW